MRYIKTYEDLNEPQVGDYVICKDIATSNPDFKLQVGVFYYIPYGSRNLILLALDKIDIVEENKYVIKSGYLFKNRDFEGIIGVYVGFTDKQDSDNYWICKNDYDKREAFDDFKNDNFYDYVYMGELVLSKDEILKDKFNL